MTDQVTAMMNMQERIILLEMRVKQLERMVNAILEPKQDEEGEVAE